MVEVVIYIVYIIYLLLKSIYIVNTLEIEYIYLQEKRERLSL